MRVKLNEIVCPKDPNHEISLSGKGLTKWTCWDCHEIFFPDLTNLEGGVYGVNFLGQVCGEIIATPTPDQPGQGQVEGKELS